MRTIKYLDYVTMPDTEIVGNDPNKYLDKFIFSINEFLSQGYELVGVPMKLNGQYVQFLMGSEEVEE